MMPKKSNIMLLHLRHAIISWGLCFALLLCFIYMHTYHPGFERPDFAIRVTDPDPVTLKIDNDTTTSSSLSKLRSVDIIDELSDLTGGSSMKDIKCAAPLIPFYDRVIRTTNITNSSDTQRIPRILHVSFKSRCLPRDLITHMERWKTTLPNYSIFFHDDNAVDRLIYENDWPQFPNLHKLMKCVKPGAMTIDVWRVLLLYKYGGIYTDIDNWPHDALTEELIDPDASAFFFSDSWTRPSQWFMASENDHPMMYLAMTNILNQILNIGWLQKISIVQVTGPQAFKWGYSTFLFNKEGIHKGGIHVGMHEMKVQKIPDGQTGKYIEGGYKFEEIVPFNATVNVTRRERIELESGVKHWNYDYNRFKNKPPHSGRCTDLIARMHQEEA